MKLALSALQGVESAILTIQNLADTHTTSLALSKILKSIGSSGFLVFHVFKFVDYFRSYKLDEDGPPYSLVNQAFGVAVGKVLEGYISALNTLYASIALRHHSSNSQLTLLELYLHTSNLRCQIEVLANLCNVPNQSGSFHKFFRGGDLLTYLYTQLQVC